jgi:two-component system response regulator AdeR
MAVIRVGALDLDAVHHTATVNLEGQARRLSLTLTEFRLLMHMAHSPRRVFTRAELVDACLAGGDALERTVDSHLSKMRKKLEAAGALGMLGGVRGLGYRLAPDQ